MMLINLWIMFPFSIISLIFSKTFPAFKKLITVNIKYVIEHKTILL